VSDPSVVHVTADDPEPLDCTPDEWVRDAARHMAAGVTLVRLESYPDGSPWDDEASELDPATGTWAFVPWPGVAFELPDE
jgi:hypothetical protein